MDRLIVGTLKGFPPAVGFTLLEMRDARLRHMVGPTTEDHFCEALADRGFSPAEVHHLVADARRTPIV